MPGLARRLSAHRPPWLVQLLRSLHSHHRLHVQPTRQMVEGHPPYSVARADRVAQLFSQLARLAAGPQRLQSPGPGVHRSRREQEIRSHPRLPSAGRQHAAVRDRSLHAQPQLRQCCRGRKTSRAAMARHGRRHQTLHRGHRHLGMGQQRPGKRTRRRHGLLLVTFRLWKHSPPSNSCANTCRN